MIVVIYGYYFIYLQLNSNILSYMSNADYITNQDIMLLFSEAHKGVQACRADEPKGNGGEIRCEPCYNQSF